jgi:hypothetical protein
VVAIVKRYRGLQIYKFLSLFRTAGKSCVDSIPVRLALTLVEEVMGRLSGIDRFDWKVHDRGGRERAGAG